MANSKKKLPIGIQSFSQMIEGDFIYVDKTRYIFDIIESGNYYFLSRPRRFGKSLLLSTMKEIFSANRKLFEGLQISTTNYKWQKHPIIFFSFTINVESAENLKKDLEWRLIDLGRQNGIDISDAPSLQTKLIALIQGLAVTHKVVILIDEYDYPLINNIHQLVLADDCRKVLHDFFIVLKELSEYIRFIFITGVTKFSKTSIFSGLNNLNDLSLSPRSATLLGYKHSELLHNFGDYIEEIALKNKTTSTSILETMRSWYNGYQFVEADTPEQAKELKVYNPFSVLLYLYNGKRSNYWADTGTPSFLTHLIRMQEYPISEIDCSEVNNEETKSYDLETIKLVPLLWQTGYLTIDSYDPRTQNYTLTYPNQEVKSSFFNYFLSQLVDTPIALLKNYITEFHKAINADDLHHFFRTFETFFAGIPYTMQLPLEKYYQSIFYVILSLIGAKIVGEDTTNDGRIDAVLESSATIYIFEFKLNESAKTALNQIEEKKYFQKYQQSGKKIVLVGVSFSTSTRNIVEWLKKDLITK